MNNCNNQNRVSITARPFRPAACRFRAAYPRFRRSDQRAERGETPDRARPVHGRFGPVAEMPPSRATSRFRLFVAALVQSLLCPRSAGESPEFI